MKRVATLFVVVGLLVAPTGLAADGTITKGYGGSGVKVQAVLQTENAPAATAVVGSASTLPFTGVDLALFSVAGMALIGMGFGLRRVSQRDDV